LDFLLAQVMLGFKSFGSELGRVSGHFTSDSLGFQVVSGRVEPSWVGFFFCHILFQIGSNFGSSDFRTFFKNSANVRSKLSIML
jgi:hypothetical protein